MSKARVQILLGVGMITVLAVVGFVCMHHHDKTTSTKRTMAVVGSPDPSYRSSALMSEGCEKIISSNQSASLFANESSGTGMQSGVCGMEMPFSLHNDDLVGMLSLETDPAKLCMVLVDALDSEKPQNVSALRSRLQALGITAVPSIIELLNAGSSRIEIEAIRLLAQIGGEQALAAALDKLLTLSTSSPDYCLYLGAFTDCRSTEVAAWLTGLLGQVQTEDARERVLAILAALRGPEVIKSLAEQLVKPTDQMHAEDCEGILVTASDPGQTIALMELLEANEKPKIQALAAYGLASIGSAEACAILVEKATSSEIIAPICCNALATVDSTYGQETLIQTALSSTAPSVVRCSAVQALSNQQGQRVQTVLANLKQATTDLALQSVINQALEIATQRTPSAQSKSFETEGQYKIEECF